MNPSLLRFLMTLNTLTSTKQLCWTLLLTVSTVALARAETIELELKDQTVLVRIDGAPFTEYRTDARMPYLWPIVGPTGVEMTRAFPMRKGVPGEAVDHVHHRSLWFGHGEVNGIDFWHDANKSGRIEHRRFVQVGGTGDPVLVVQNDWLDDDGEKQCSDVRVMRFGAQEGSRWIDFDISILADADQPVEFGDTKEGCLGIRVAATMKVDAEPGGEIINNEDDRNEETWGKTGAWIDYHGPIGDSTVGIAVFNHPDSFRFPTYWHVRNYGLLAANVFGLRAFRNAPNEDGSLVLQPGESVTFCYRILLHEGDENAGDVRETFIEYAKVDKSLTPATLVDQLDEAPVQSMEPEIEIQPRAQTASLPSFKD